MKNAIFNQLPLVVSSSILGQEPEGFEPEFVEVRIVDFKVRDASLQTVLETKPVLECYYGLGDYRSSIIPLDLNTDLQDWFNALP